MKEFFEPMLFLSTPDHPNTMGAIAVLKEAVDGEILRDVVEDLRLRFPYFYVQAVVRENDIFPEPNALPSEPVKGKPLRGGCYIASGSESENNQEAVRVVDVNFHYKGLKSILVS